MNNTSLSSNKKMAADGHKQLNYGDVVEYLDAHWCVESGEKGFERTKALDLFFGKISEKIDSIIIAGTNGKSLTAHLTSKLLKAEGLKVGTLYSPHILTYNERLTINEESISNKNFAEIGSEVIDAAQKLNLNCNSGEILTIMGLLYFVQQSVEICVMESSQGGKFNPVNICNAKIATITRVTEEDIFSTDDKLKESVEDLMGVVKPGTWIVSGDQNKSHLQYMQDLSKSYGANWAMPIRKLAALPYPFEQLHGRCAALAERLAQMYVDKFLNKDATIVVDSILSKQKGQRGRPTTEAKKQAELNPKKTVEQFWKEEVSQLPGRFELLDKDKPSVLLDNACNIDAFKNLVLGIRLLHYQKPLKGLAIVVGAAKDKMHNEEFLKLVRYFFKKISGQIFICPIDSAIPGLSEDVSWDVEVVANDFKTMKMKARACTSFEEAFNLAKKSVDERNGLVVVAGSQSLINNYWKLRGIKKF